MKRKVSILLLLVMILTSLLPITALAESKPVRISGNNRYMTSVEVSKFSYESAGAVVIASGEGFADALAGGALANAVDGPILLVGKETVSDSVIDEIKRLGTSKIYLLGGSGTISETVEDELKNLAEVERIAGADRYQTSILITKKVMEIKPVEAVLVANGTNFADALSAGGYIVKKSAALVLTNGKTISDELEALLGELENFVVLGGENSVSGEVQDALNATRIEGKNRYETALNVAKDAFGTLENAILVDGTNYPDGLASVAVAKMKDAPILLTTKSGLTENVLQYLREGINLTIVGGEGSVPNAVIDQILENVTPDPMPEPEPEQPLYNSNAYVAARSAVAPLQAFVINSEGERITYGEYKWITAPYRDVMIATENDGNIKLINVKGEVVKDLGKEITWHSEYSDGLCAMGIVGKIGYKDLEGNWAVTPVYDFGHSFFKGVAAVTRNKQNFLINKSGEIIARLPNGSLRTIYDGYHSITNNDGVTIYNNNGEALFKTSDEHIKYIEPDLFLERSVGPGVDKILNNRGEVQGTFPATYKKHDNVLVPEMIRDGLIVVVGDNGKMYYVDYYGNKQFDREFEKAWNFSYGYAVVYENGSYKIINTRGEILADCSQYDYVWNVEQGFFYAGNENETCLINAVGDVVFWNKFDWSMLGYRFEDNFREYHYKHNQ